MSHKYTYSKATDFPSGLSRAKLIEEINASLSVPLENGRIDVGGDEALDVVELYFENTLSAEDKTALDGDVSPAGGIIGSHSAVSYDHLPKEASSETEEDIISISPQDTGEMTVTLRKGSYVLTWGASIKGNNRNRKVVVQILQDDSVLQQFKFGIDDCIPIGSRVPITMTSTGQVTFKIKAYCEQPKSMVTISNIFLELKEA